ncbi:LppX_LprAFG lipoprotein [Nocardioides seonyuensis]|uniref:LppX_LprAFG lipoprotein n=1 Tax=Nocardioides seonyuensis TaxID=2518371 RepID=A0A4P7ILD2_9ACTN|nr:LppX_LprAFG lipoprotein [Nocardioides seonyuensis]QBX56901.1 LppX_LprAFG lipoprotein [Nocardioides seonyuensis]
MTAPRLRTLGALAAALLLVPSLAACSGDDASSEVAEQSPEEVLAEAATNLSETTGLQLDLSTRNLPDGVTGITKAAGVATSAPAFEGTITVVLSGQSVDVPVVAIDDTVYAQIPFTPGWNKVDPTDYGAPDPARLIDPSTGFPALLDLTEEPTKGESVRGGADNSEVLTTYTGTVPGDAMADVIPSAAGDTFEVEWQVTDEGELRKADLSGVFYAKSEEMTYTVEFSGYGTEKDITAP